MKTLLSPVCLEMYVLIFLTLIFWMYDDKMMFPSVSRLRKPKKGTAYSFYQI